MALPSITVTARLVDAPEIKWSQSGTAIAKLRLVSNARKLNKDTQQWEDGSTWWGRGTAFARTAEAIAEANLQKGDLVTVRGDVETQQWETDGQKRSADEVIIREIGRALTPPRQQSGSFSAPQGGYNPAQGGRGQVDVDPWAAPQQATSEPPF
ncbi:single-stranded DNA-binding protein [Nocardiopsis sp. NRRL B-16309]|uniref:single-stranded DNA-binding protein n=1 Tax=Nocardiopsis sp. NRRL B-16309 TaxID=1519494 RepID=UPI0006AF9D00|nr:single-stranded DNA-binding protein [Nocardiopsis sp. NRRL B-16309]